MGPRAQMGVGGMPGSPWAFRFYLAVSVPYILWVMSMFRASAIALLIGCSLFSTSASAQEEWAGSLQSFWDGAGRLKGAAAPGPGESGGQGGPVLAPPPVPGAAPVDDLAGYAALEKKFLEGIPKVLKGFGGGSLKADAQALQDSDLSFADIPDVEFFHGQFAQAFAGTGPGGRDRILIQRPDFQGVIQELLIQKVPEDRLAETAALVYMPLLMHHAHHLALERALVRDPKSQALPLSSEAELGANAAELSAFRKIRSEHPELARYFTDPGAREGVKLGYWRSGAGELEKRIDNFFSGLPLADRQKLIQSYDQLYLPEYRRMLQNMPGGERKAWIEEDLKRLERQRAFLADDGSWKRASERYESERKALDSEWSAWASEDPLLKLRRPNLPAAERARLFAESLLLMAGEAPEVNLGGGGNPSAEEALSSVEARVRALPEGKERRDCEETLQSARELLASRYLNMARVWAAEGMFKSAKRYFLTAKGVAQKGGLAFDPAEEKEILKTAVLAALEKQEEDLQEDPPTVSEDFWDIYKAAEEAGIKSEIEPRVSEVSGRIALRLAADSERKAREGRIDFTIQFMLPRLEKFYALARASDPSRLSQEQQERLQKAREAAGNAALKLLEAAEAQAKQGRSEAVGRYLVPAIERFARLAGLDLSERLEALRKPR